MKVFTVIVATLLVLVFSPLLFAQNYTGASGPFPACQACHSSETMPEYNQWVNTAHASAYDSASAFVQTTATCLQCHTTGWDTTQANMGADDFVTVDTSGTITITDSTEFFKKVNVQCEACHGPTEFGVNHPPITRIDAFVCGECHQDEHHPYIEEWELSKHAIADTNASAFLQNLFRTSPTCSGCHTFQGFIQFVGTTAADTANMEPNVANPPGDESLPIVCAACHDPHNKLHEGQLRLEPAELCIKCHNPEEAQPPDEPHHSTASMWEGTGAVEFPGYTYVTQSDHQITEPAQSRRCVTCHVFMTPFDPGPPVVPAATGHTFYPRLEACGQSGCHVGGLTTFDYNGRQTTIDSLLAELDARLAAASSADSATVAFQEALFNFQFVENDGSRGVHNFNYARDILVNTINYIDTVFTAIQPLPEAGIPSTFSLQQNYPNPFNPSTTIRFDIPRATHVRLMVYNSLGQVVATLVDKQLAASSYKVTFDASNLPTGLYFYRIVTDNYSQTRKMLFLK